MSYIEYELRRNQIFIAGSASSTAIVLSDLRAQHGLSVDPLQVLFYDGKWQWVLVGPWQRKNNLYQLECVEHPGIRVSKSVTDAIYVLSAGLESGDAFSLVFVPRPGAREWTQVPLKAPYSYLVEMSEIKSENDSVVFLLTLRGRWLLQVVVTDLSGPKASVESSLYPADRQASLVSRHAAHSLAEPMVKDVQASVWPNPRDVGKQWRLFSLWSNEPKLCSAVYISRDGTVRRDEHVVATAGASMITARTLSWTTLERPTIMVELGQDAKLTYLLAQPVNVVPEVEYDVYIDLGTTTTYLVYCRTGEDSSSPRRVEALDCDLSKASVLFMNDPQRSLNALWIPEGVRPPPEFGVTSVVRTALITRQHSSSEFKPFEEQFLATPAALQHTLEQTEVELFDRRLKWCFADENERAKEYFQHFVRLLLVWTASRLIHEERGLATIRLHLSHPRRMRNADQYTQSFGEAMSYVRAVTGLNVVHAHGEAWPDEGLLPYFAAKAWVRESDGLRDATLVKLLVADLGGGTLDLAGYVLTKHDTRVLFSRSLRVGADECFSDPFREHVKAQGNNDLPKRWFLEVASPRDPLARRLGQPSFVEAKNVLTHYREFLSWSLKICALTMHHDTEWALRDTALRIDIDAAHSSLDSLRERREEYRRAPLILFLSGGGWKWFLNPEGLVGDSVMPSNVRMVVRFCEKRDALVGAARQPRGAESGSGSDVLDAFPRGCHFEPDAGPLEFVRIANGEGSLYGEILGQQSPDENKDLASLRGAMDCSPERFKSIKQDPFVHNITRSGFKRNKVIWRGGGSAPHENTVHINSFDRVLYNGSWLLYCLESVGERFKNGGA